MNEKVFELRRRGHSYRNFEPSDVRELLEDDEVSDSDVRDFLEFMESGRFEPMLDQTHKMFAHLDVDEAETFWERNPDLMAWVNVWGKANHLIDWNDSEMIQSPDE